MAQIELIDVDKIIPYAFNNKIHNERQVELLADSILEFGFRVPIIVDADMVIITGHARLEAAKKAGLTEIPTIVASDMTKAQKKKYRILDNRIADLSQYDKDNLKLELEEIGIPDLTALFEDLHLEEQTPLDIDPLEGDNTKVPKTVTCPECSHSFEI